MRKFLVVVGALFVGSTAHAALISDTSWDGPGKDLQSLFNGWVGPGYDINTHYQTPGLWTIGSAGQASAVFLIEIAGNASYNTFGLFDAADASKRLEVYNGAAGAGAKRAITYDGATHQYAVGNTQTWTLLDSEVFSGSTFGFYLDGPGGTFFSIADLNLLDAVQMVAFEGANQTANFQGKGNAPWLSNEWVLAWEDLPYGSSDKDFNDLVLIMESVKPVPEPGTISLLGAGLVGLAMIRRRKRVA